MPIGRGGKEEKSIMDQKERRLFLIDSLISEDEGYRGLRIPADDDGQRRLLRALMNVRPPKPVSREFLKVQDEYLHEAIAERGIVRLSDLEPVQDVIYLWRGDITELECGAIVNAANSGMTGCYQPCHGCIDNAIHTYAGVQLRLKCAEIMKRQGHEEPVGSAKITPAYNLPCRYVIHTVGPYVQGRLTEKHCRLLRSCYLSCLELADSSGIDSIAFCCISTGVFMFPDDKAAEIAVRAVKEYREDADSSIKVIFNVYKEKDERIYRRLLLRNSQA